MSQSERFFKSLYDLYEDYCNKKGIESDTPYMFVRKRMAANNKLLSFAQLQELKLQAFEEVSKDYIPDTIFSDVSFSYLSLAFLIANRDMCSTFTTRCSSPMRCAGSSSVTSPCNGPFPRSCRTSSLSPTDTHKVSFSRPRVLKSTCKTSSLVSSILLVYYTSS